MVLIVDDSPMNRDILSEILCDDFEILEAPDGPQCLELLNAWGSDISIVLLDIVMPDMDGFDVLSRMSAQGWLEDIPVVMISSEDSSQTVRRAYELGASDYISRPFDARIVHRRVSNVARLYARQRRLSALVSQQFYDREKNDQIMIGILGQVTEIHNSESIHHISRVQRITSILLERLCQKTDIYGLSGMDRYLITTASALHDIGKVAIDDRILNAHDLTPEQTAILHTHPILGAQMLENLSQYQDEPLVKFAIQICRWHHERWDGSGYLMHDDQHGTAIISSAGLVNALQVAGKKIEDVKIVVNGAGASAVSCTKLYVSLGARLENIVMLDSKGVISKARTDLNEQKRFFATDRTDIHTLEEAIKGADVFLGLSKGNVLSQDMVRSMAPMPIVFALANPTPEISYEDAMAARPDVLMATGRSDYPNQINNVIGFPYIFRGALDTHAKAINEEMKIAAVHAIANLAKQPVPDVVNAAYHVNNLSFGAEYFIPKPVDPRLITEVSCAVAKAAMESGVARTEIKDWDAYCVHLRELMGYESKLTRQLYDTARRSPQRVVFAEGIHPNMLKAAVEAKAEGICHPILLGNDEAIGKLAEEMDLSLEGIEIVNLRHPDESERRERYSRILAEKRAREGFTYEEANDKMFERNYFGMMMVETGDADAFITGLYTRYSNTIKVAKEVIGIQPGFKHFGTMHILNSKKGTYFLADTLINRHPDTETLIDIAKLSDKTVRFFNHTPVISMLSYSNFGADTAGSPVKVHEAVAHMQEEYPELAIDGEMQVNFAMNRELRDTKYPFTRLKGKDVNTLIFPNLSSANAGYKLLQAMDPDTEFIGPIQMGLNKPIHFTDFESSVRDIVNITAVAVIDAIVDKKKRGGK